jgi:acetyl esterase/lipase
MLSRRPQTSGQLTQRKPDRAEYLSSGRQFHEGKPMKMFPTRHVIVVTTVAILLGYFFARPGWAELAAPAKEIPLYAGAAPGSEGWTWSERAAGSANNPTVQNVVHPVLLYYPADKAKAVGTAMVIAPGGGFTNLMMSYEGVDIAKRMNEMGVDAFVLKYRLRYSAGGGSGARGRATSQPAGAAPPRGGGRAPTTAPQAGQDIRALAAADGQQAIRILREHASGYGFKPDRIGMIGYSAGGSVVIRTAKGPAETRPTFLVGIYPADANGDAPPAGAPPLFLAVGSDDQAVGFRGSVDMFLAWRQANIPVELHVFQMGSHGFVRRGGGADHYLDRVEEWMKVNGFLNK